MLKDDLLKLKDATMPLGKILACGIIELAKTTHPDSRKGAWWGFCLYEA